MTVWLRRIQHLTVDTLPQTSPGDCSSPSWAGDTSSDVFWGPPKGWRVALPLILLLAAVLVFFARVLFTKRYIVPWDFRGFHLPMAMLVFNALKGAGSVFWDTTTYCGRPLFADPQAQVFYPPTDLAIFVATFFGSSRLAYILEWELALHVFAAGAFTYLMLRRIGTSTAAALCGGLVFELGGFFASQTQHVGAIDGAAWIPLMWTAAWEFRNTLSKRWFGILAVACAMTILAGFPAMTTTAMVSTILLTGVLWLSGEMPFRGAAFVLAAFALGLGLSGVMLIPAIQLTFLSVGKYRTDWFDGWGFPPKYLITLLTPPNHVTICDLIYCGTGGLMLALIGASGIHSKRNRNTVVPILLITSMSAIWMLGTATIFGRAVWAVIPKTVKGSLYPHYGMATFCLGMAALAGIGIDRLRSCSTRCKYLIVLAVAADLILVGSGRPMNAFDVTQEPGITNEQINGSEATLARLRGVMTRGSLVRFDTHETSPEWTTTAPLTQLPTANGYDPLALERLIQVRLSFAKGYRCGAWYEVENLGSPVIDALNVRYILTYKRLDSTRSYGRDLSLRAEFPGFLLYENPSALPRFFLVHRIRFVHTPEEAFTEIHRADFTPSSVAVVEEGDSEWNGRARLLQIESKPTGGDDGSAIRVRLYNSREVLLEVRAEGPSFLVTSEVQYPGWHAWLDGAEVPIFMTNGAFRGLTMPVGIHSVLFRFTPGVLNVGLAVSILSLCAAILVFRIQKVCR